MADIKLIDYDFAKFGSSAERKRLLSRWDTGNRRKITSERGQRQPAAGSHIAMPELSRQSRHFLLLAIAGLVGLVAAALVCVRGRLLGVRLACGSLAMPMPRHASAADPGAGHERIGCGRCSWPLRCSLPLVAVIPPRRAAGSVIAARAASACLACLLRAS